MKHINLTQMLQGCSKGNGMTVSASMHDDGQNCNVKQRAELMSEDEKWSENGALSSTCLRSALVPLSFRSRYLRYAAMIFAVLMMSVANVGMAWGDTTLFSTEFSNALWSDKTFSQGNTTTPHVYNGITFYCKSGSTQFAVDQSAGEMTWCSNNMGSNNYFLAIPITGINNGTITITANWVAVSTKSPKLTWDVKSGATSVVYSGLSNNNTHKVTGSAGGTVTTITIDTIDAANKSAVVYLGRGSSDCTKLTSITITTPAASSCTAPNHVDISGAWDKFGGETISLTATAYSSAGTGSPIADANITGWQWQKLIGTTWTDVSNGTVGSVVTSGATTKNLQITNCGQGNSGKYRCVVSTGATCSTASATATDGSEGYGVKVYVLECYTGGTTVYNFTRDGENQAGSVTINLSASTAYTFKVHADDYYGNSGTINFDVTNWVCSTSQGNLTVNSGLGGTFTFDVEYSTGGNSSVEGEPELSVTYPRKTVYLKPNSNWKSNNAKFAFYYFHKNGEDTDKDGWTTGFLSASVCDGDVYPASIPQWNGVKIIGVRFNSSEASPGWNGEGHVWNQTDDLVLTSNDLVEITGWSNSQTYTSSYDAPEYTISFAGNGNTSGSMTDVEDIECDASVTLEANAFVKTGYTFTGWKDASSNDYADEATISNIRADIELTAQWTADTYDVTTTLTNVTVSSGTTGTDAATYGTAYSVTFAGSTGYNLPGSVVVMRGETNITANCTWTQGTGVLTIPAAQVTGNISISATGVAKTTAITLDAGDGGTDGSATATYGTSTITDYEPATRTGYTLGNYYRDGSKNNILTDEGTLNSGNKGSLIVDGKWASEDAAVTLYAQWTAIDYTIAYDLAGGSVASPNPTGYTIESSAITLNNPTKTGYTFAGWTGTGLAEATTTVTIAAGSTGNRSYTATWTPIVPSSVSLNKSSTTITVGGTETLTATISPAVVADNTITWSTSDADVATVDGGVVTAVAAGTATITATTHNDKTATCEVTVAPAVTYTVTYEYNGATSGASPESATGASVSLPNPTKEGYTLQGWYTSSGSLAGAATATYNPTSDITLYALWREDACAGGGGGGTAATITIGNSASSSYAATFTSSSTSDKITASATAFTYGSSITPGSSTYTSATAPYSIKYKPNANISTDEWSDDYSVSAQFSVASGYTFSPSSISATIVTEAASYTYQAILTDGVTTYTSSNVSSSANGKFTFSFPSLSGTALSGTVTFKVRFKSTANNKKFFVFNLPITISGTVAAAGGGGSGTCYYVTYNGNGADGGFTTDEASHPSGSNVTVKTNSFTKTGYTFTGWNTEAEGTGTPYTAGGTISGISGNMILYAQWIESGSTYDITYHCNDATSGCPDNATGQVALPDPLATPTKTNYSFGGWYTNAALSSEAVAGATLDDDADLYAKWTQTITLKTGTQGSGADKTPTVVWQGTALNGFSAHAADGYTLQGYYTAGSGGVKVLNADGTFAAANVTDYITSSKWSRTGAAPTLFAQWVAAEDCSTSNFVIKKGDGTEYQGCMESSSYNGTATSFTAGSPTTVGNAKMTISNYNDGVIKRPGSGNTFSIVIEPVSGYYLKSICWAGKVESGETVSYYWDDDSGSATTISAQTTSGTGVTYNAPSSTTKFTASYVDDGVDGGGIWWRNVQVEVCAAGVTTYSVTYDGNDKTGGTAPTDASSPYAYGATVTVLGNTGSLTKTSYTFAGWTTNNNGTGSSYEAGSTFSITDNTTLYAKWTQAVTFDANTANHGSAGGSATAVWNATGLTGITHATPASGYKLLGYYTAATSGTKVLNSDGSFADTDIDGYITDGKWSRTGTAPTLYAQYESAGALTWNLVVKSDTSALSTSTKTSAFTEISTANMSNATVNGLTYTGNAKASLTGKISTPAYDAGKYVYVTFQIASGYKFTPSMIQVPVQPVGNGEHKAVELRLTDDASHSLVSASATKCDGTSSGKTTTVTLAGDGTFFTGTVTMKIYVYPHATASASSNNCYRLGTPITIEGEIEEACGTMPSYTSMSYTTTTFAPSADASGSPITIVGGDNINTYQWKYNTVNDRTSGTNCGTNSASLTPLTDASATTDGTRYYWCEMTNTSCGITIKSPAVAITVAAAKSDASVTWTDPASTPNYGGGGYTIRATVDQSVWNGDAADLTISAPAGINIYNVTPGTDGSSRKYVEVNFDVQTSFDRETYSSNIPFTVSAAATASYNAISDEKDVDYSACTGGSASEELMPVNADSVNSTVKGWRFAGTGKMWYGHGSSTPGTGSSNIKSLSNTMAEGNIDHYYNSGGSYFSFYTEKAITGVRLYVYTSNSNVKVSNVYIANSQFATGTPSSGAVTYEVVYNDDNEGLDKGDNVYSAWAEITFASEVAAGKYGLIKLDNNVKIAGIGLISTSGGGATLNTYLQWSGSLADGATVNKNTTDAYFTYSASKITENTNTLGAITYSSSNTSAATVDATGKVALVAAGETTIKATLAASGCYKKAEISYRLNVTEVPCAITAGTLTLTSGTESKCSSDNVTLTLTGFESGASIQWKDGDTDINNGGNYTIATDGTTSTLTTNQEGTYSVMVTSGCNVRSNRITISNKSTEVGAKRIVKNWYIKNGRLTPDIELWTLQNGAHLSSVTWDPANATGLADSDFYESDGKVYLKGKEPSSNASGADINYTLMLTVEDDCGSTTAMSASGQLIYLHHQKNTDKHVLAFVVNGTDKGGFTEGIEAAQTTSVPLYNEIAANFDVLATNIKSTDDEQALKEYYSQFDILCVTDYPNTGDEGVNKKSYVDALGALVDIRPILTMEAFVSKLANWKAKGISGTPQSPTTRQYTMLMQCKDHEIFSGTELTKVGEGDETMYRISMVDNTQEEYVSLDATYGAGTHEKDKNYQYGKKPALQGFTFDATMADDGLLPLGRIDDGAGNDLEVGIERQTKMEARLMVLGINSYAMERLTDDGQTVVVNALKYLMKKNSEDIADCSNTFVGGDDEEDESTRYDWNVDSHWSGNAVPERTQKVRIVAPCVIKADEKVHVTGVVIAPRGKYNHGANTANGSLTIAAGGALIVDGKVEAATAPLYTETRATSAEDLTIQASETAQGALIFDNEDGETQATVEMYSPSYWEVDNVTGKKKKYWSYVAMPITEVPVGEYFYGAFTYLYSETSGWTKKGMYTTLYPFDGIGLSMQDGHKETFRGTLVSTENREITLTHDNTGKNMVGNSWTAPIQIANFDADDFGDATASVLIFNTGNNNEGTVIAEDGGSGTSTAGQWLTIPISVARLGGYTGLKVIPSMQAFQVNTSTETTLTLDYDKLVRDVNIASDNLTEPQRAPRKAKKEEVDIMRVRVNGENTHTDVWLLEDERFSDEFDNGWEAKYVACDDRSAQLYAVGDPGKMAFIALPDIEGTVLGFAPSRDGNEYLFTFHYIGKEEYYLNDLKLKQSVLISEDKSYSFMYEDGDTNRFYISRTRIDAPQMPTGVDNAHEGAVKAHKFIYNDKLYIMLNGRVYSAEGALVK